MGWRLSLCSLALFFYYLLMWTDGRTVCFSRALISASNFCFLGLSLARFVALLRAPRWLFSAFCSTTLSLVTFPTLCSLWPLSVTCPSFRRVALGALLVGDSTDTPSYHFSSLFLASNVCLGIFAPPMVLVITFVSPISAHPWFGVLVLS